MPKHVLFFADGTWNSPDQEDDKDNSPDPTNVYKLFLRVDGEYDPISMLKNQEQEVALKGADGSIIQIGKYINGVGASDNPINKILGGTLGAGIIKRIVRGYTFISRNYEPGDKIHIIGFSRGAYTARALGGLLVSQGVLRKELTVNQEDAYVYGASAWYRYREEGAKRNNLFGRLLDALSDLPAWLSQGKLQDSDLVPIDSIETIAVWDTVGSLGIPAFASPDTRLDVFRLANTALSPKVKLGVHAISLDERRFDFTPTLWDAADNVEQLLFSGAHADVGGGYSLKGNESGLSDIALDWLRLKLIGRGVQLSRPGLPCAPDPMGVAHQPWREPPFNTLLQAARQFPAYIAKHESVLTREQKLAAAGSGQTVT
jgi:uncharacterized protein (DUF2235 family)